MQLPIIGIGVGASIALPIAAIILASLISSVYFDIMMCCDRRRSRKLHLALRRVQGEIELEDGREEGSERTERSKDVIICVMKAEGRGSLE